MIVQIAPNLAHRRRPETLLNRIDRFNPLALFLIPVLLVADICSHVASPSLVARIVAKGGQLVMTEVLLQAIHVLAGRVDALGKLIAYVIMSVAGPIPISWLLCRDAVKGEADVARGHVVERGFPNTHTTQQTPCEGTYIRHKIITVARPVVASGTAE